MLGVKTGLTIAAVLHVFAALPAFSQTSVIISEREPTAVYDPADLNPIDPLYEYDGSTLLQNIRVIDHTGADPLEGQDVLVVNGTIAPDVTMSGQFFETAPVGVAGEAMHREMELWVHESVISPLQTIKGATHNNARILKIEDKTGSIAVGLEGDLLVVEGNPAENISDTRNIQYVFNNGKIVDRQSLTRQ